MRGEQQMKVHGSTIEGYGQPRPQNLQRHRSFLLIPNYSTIISVVKPTNPVCGDLVRVDSSAINGY